MIYDAKSENAASLQAPIKQSLKNSEHEKNIQAHTENTLRHVRNAPVGDVYDIRPASRYIAELQHKGYPLAQFRKYHGQYHFYGRMKKSVLNLDEEHLQNWLDDHPDGRVVLYLRHLPEKDINPEYVARFRGRYITVWNRDQIAINPALSGLQ